MANCWVVSRIWGEINVGVTSILLSFSLSVEWYQGNCKARQVTPGSLKTVWYELPCWPIWTLPWEKSFLCVEPLSFWRLYVTAVSINSKTRPLQIMPLLCCHWAAAAAKSLRSCPTLCNPIDGSPPGSTIPGILQARILEWVAISFSNAWKWKVKVKSLSRVQLFETPWTAAYQAPPSMGFSRQEYWNGLLLPSPATGLVIGKGRL